MLRREKKNIKLVNEGVLVCNLARKHAHLMNHIFLFRYLSNMSTSTNMSDYTLLVIRSCGADGSDSEQDSFANNRKRVRVSLRILIFSATIHVVFTYLS